MAKNWQPDTDYSSCAPVDVVTKDGQTYFCTTSHRSTSTFDGAKFALAGSPAAPPSSGGSVTSDSITDATAAGKALLTATNVVAQLTALGLAAAIAITPANKIWAGPATGVDAAPTFRSLVAADIPDLSATYATPSYVATQIANLAALGVAQSFTAQQTFAMGTITTSKPLTYSATWNAGGVSFDGFLADITSTASAATSNLFHGKVGGADKFYVDKVGGVYVPVTAGGYWCDVGGNTGMYGEGTSRLTLWAAGVRLLSGTTTAVAVASTTAIGWTSGAANASVDAQFCRDGPGIVHLRNGGTFGSPVPQELRFANYYASGSDYEIFRTIWSSNTLFLQTLATGSGTARDIHIQSGGGNLNVRNCNLIFFTDNAYDIGASGANRPRSIYAGTNITAGDTLKGTNVEAIGAFYFTGSKVQMRAGSSDGVLKLTKSDASSAATVWTGFQTVSALPTASSYPGSSAFVSDATSTTPRSTVAGGGSNKVMVMSDGTNWLIVA